MAKRDTEQPLLRSPTLGILVDNATIRAALRAVGAIRERFEYRHLEEPLGAGWTAGHGDWRSARIAVFEHDLTALVSLVDALVLSERVFFLPYSENPSYWAKLISNEEEAAVLGVLEALMLSPDERSEIEKIAKSAFLTWAGSREVLKLTGDLLQVLSTASKTSRDQVLRYISPIWPLAEVYWHRDQQAGVARLFEKRLRQQIFSDPMWPSIDRGSEFNERDEVVIWLSFQAIFYRYLATFKRLAYVPHPARGRLVLYDLFRESSPNRDPERLKRSVLEEIGSWREGVRPKRLSDVSSIAPILFPPVFFYVLTQCSSASEVIPAAIRLRSHPAVAAFRAKLNHLSHANSNRQLRGFLSDVSSACTDVARSLGLEPHPASVEFELSLLFAKLKMSVPVPMPSGVFRRWRWGQRHLAFVRDVAQVNMLVHSIDPYYDRLFSPILREHYLEGEPPPSSERSPRR